MRVIHTPVRAPNANAYTERVIEAMRAECLDWTLILGRVHLGRTLRTCAEHYNRLTAASRARPRLTAPSGRAADPGRPAQCRSPRPARWAHPRVLRPRRMTESGFPIPTPSAGRDLGACRTIASGGSRPPDKRSAAPRVGLASWLAGRPGIRALGPAADGREVPGGTTVEGGHDGDHEDGRPDPDQGLVGGPAGSASGCARHQSMNRSARA
jgi:hypothetical protein